MLGGDNQITALPEVALLTILGGSLMLPLDPGKMWKLA